MIYNYFIQRKSSKGLNRNIVKKLYKWDNQQEILLNKLVPAGTVTRGVTGTPCGADNNRSSETIRNNINKLYREKISEHIPKHNKPLNDKELGYYLAGLIDGVGEINSSKLIIYLNKNDNSLAYWLKKRIGYGKIKKSLNNKELKLIITNIEGLVRVLELINGKLKWKYDEVNNKMLLNNTLINLKWNKKEFIKGDIKDMNNYWLAGLIDGAGNLEVLIPYDKLEKNMEIKFKLYINIITNKLINLELNEIIRFIYNINNKTSNELIKLPVLNINSLKIIDLNGNIKFKNNLEIISLKLAKKIISYLSKYNLQSYKYLNYIYFYKIYLLRKKNLLSTTTLEDLEKNILKIKKFISRMK